MKRREFVKIIGVSPGVLAASWSLAEAQQRLFAHLVPAEQRVPPDAWIVHRTQCTECPAGCGLLVKARQGKPIKLEGDPAHPVSEGGLCLRGQAALGRLYHPERLKQPMQRQAQGWAPLSWEQAFARIASVLEDERAAHCYLGRQASGSLADALARFGEARRVEVLPALELFHHGAIRAANELLFGHAEVPDYRIDEADLVLSFGAELLEGFVDPVRYNQRFARGQAQGMRWHHFEPHLSLTGSNAQHRHVIRPGSEAWLLAWLLDRLPAAATLPAAVRDAVPPVDDAQAAARTGLGEDVLSGLLDAIAQASRPLLLAGGSATGHEGGWAVALLCGLLQHATGAIGELVDFDASSPLAGVGTLAELAGHAERLQDQAMGVLFLSRVHSLEPVPGLEQLRDRARLAVGLTDFLHPSMTGCDLVLPLSHSLESVGDIEARRGLHGRLARVFNPLFDSRQEEEILVQLAGLPEQWPELAERRQRALGLADPAIPVAEAPSPRPRAELRGAAAADALRQASLGEPLSSPALIVVPSLRTGDGSSRVIALLHEVPDPLSAVSYGRYASLSAPDAAGWGVADGDGISLTLAQGSLELAARVQPGAPAGVAAVTIDHAEGLRLPVDPRTGEALRCLGGLRIDRTRARPTLTILAGSMYAAERGILPGDVHVVPGHARAHAETRRLYDPPVHDEYRWGMVVDLDRCTGCSACVAACYAENNIPLVGPEEHRKGRELSWLRVQPYRDGERPIEFIPMMCQQCSSAPCETVCPVFATYHNPEGLNVQVYNRCVGTRYCANNCPYKARRFNWFSPDWTEPLELMLNPDVPVRPRGVMEKCTFCLQRIREAKDLAKDQGRLVRDGEFTTACAQSCPARAIVFGNLLDADSEVSRLARSADAYLVLEELGTGPAVHYLRKDGNGHEF